MDAKTKTQSSRKGKKAWRKNIVDDDIQHALDAKREKQILHGDSTEGEFVIDTVGSTSAAAPVKVLRTTEILTNKSKVPAFQTHKTKAKVGKTRAHKLMVLAGRSLTESKRKARTDADGLVKGSNVDLWGEQETQEAVPEIANTSYTKATKVPETLKHTPLALHSKSPADNLVHAGKSYNPSLEAWKSLIDREYVTENEAQMKIQELEDERERIGRLMATLDDNEVDDSADDAAEDDDEEANGNPEDKYRLSANDPVQVKRKTRTQRNREERHKQQLALHTRLRELKKQLHDITHLPKIEKEVAKKLESEKKRAPRIYKSHSKHEPVFRPLEVKLADELTNDLRRVRPEGNPFYEQMHQLQMSGKIEARVPVNHRRRYKQKYAEKYSYKNFK